MTSLMNGHSKVSGPPPTHLFRLFGTNRGRYGDLNQDQVWQELSEDVELNFSCKLGSWLTSMTAEELREMARNRSAAALLRALYEKEAEADNASHIFVKENHTYSFAPFLLSGFPDCLFVFLTRDPRDVAKSWVRTVSIPGGVEKAVDVWSRDQAAALDLADQLTDSGRGLVVRYEDLIADTPATLQRVTAHLGLKYEEEMLQFNEDRRTRANAERIDAWANLQKPVISDNAGKYRDVLSEADQRYVELACGPLMKRLGYSCDLETESPEETELGARLDALRPDLNPGGYEIPTAEEQAIREKRLAAIHRVLDRRPR